MSSSLTCWIDVTKRIASSKRWVLGWIGYGWLSMPGFCEIVYNSFCPFILHWLQSSKYVHSIKNSLRSQVILKPNRIYLLLQVSTSFNFFLYFLLCFKMLLGNVQGYGQCPCQPLLCDIKENLFCREGGVWMCRFCARIMGRGNWTSFPESD